MGGAHDFVVLPALAIAVLPVARLVGDDAVAVGEGVDVLAKEGQAVEEMAHLAALLSCGPDHPRHAGTALLRVRMKPMETMIAATASTT